MTTEVKKTRRTVWNCFTFRILSFFRQWREWRWRQGQTSKLVSFRNKCDLSARNYVTICLWQSCIKRRADKRRTRRRITHNDPPFGRLGVGRKVTSVTPAGIWKWYRGERGRPLMPAEVTEGWHQKESVFGVWGTELCSSTWVSAHTHTAPWRKERGREREMANERVVLKMIMTMIKLLD